MTEPFESPPDVWRGSRSKRPGNAARGPHHAPARLSAQLFSAQTYPKLGARGQCWRQADIKSTQRANSPFRSCEVRHTARALGKMLPEPLLVHSRNSFYSFLRDQPLGSGVQFLAHATSPASNTRKSSSPL